MNYYETLGVSRSAEPQVIEAAYKAMMRRYHPDVFDGPRETAEKRSKELNEAYAVLRDPTTRASYDRQSGFETEAERPKAKPQPSPVDPEATPEPWEWGNDPLGQRSSPTPKPTKVWLTIGLASAGVATFAASLNSLTPDKAGASQTPLADPTAWAAAPSPSPIATETAPPAASEKNNCKGADCRVLTSFGWGGIEAGVTTDSAEHSSGMKIRDDGHYTDAGDGTCLSYEVVGGPKNVWMLVENGTVSTVEASYDPKLPVFRTDRGVKLGDPERAVRAAYKDLKQLPDIYREPPDKKLFYYEPGRERGIKFSIVKGKVEGISVGTSSIEYVEGCL